MAKSTKEKSVSFSVPILTILLIMFVGSKVFQVGICKDWTWAWVLSPIWLPLLILAGIFAVIGIVWIILKAIS